VTLRACALALQVIAERDVAIAERDAARIEKAKLAAERDQLQSFYEHVHHLLRKANDHRFGARNERLERLPADQLQFALEDIEASLAKNEAAEEKKEPRLPRTPTRKRGALPKRLPRVHETVAPPNARCRGTVLLAVKNHTEYGDTFLGWRGLGLEPFCFLVDLEGLIVDFGVGDVICAGVQVLFAADFEQLDAVVRADLVFGGRRGVRIPRGPALASSRPGC
jgi:hypothetical protein